MPTEGDFLFVYLFDDDALQNEYQVTSLNYSSKY